jgi:SAM-dependent methyltransferase
MTHTFYRAFEDRYRGSRDTIKDRLRAYAPFLGPLLQLARPAVALDLGCGRGEWLELLGEHGFDARGVDLDEGMLAACRERGLNARHGDALAALRTQPDASLVLVSAFHLVEHLPFGLVQELIAEALRALQPGGLLIMETPNPENLTVGATSFYLDPSHLHPLPPGLLGFAAEHAGFARQRIVRLQEDPHLHTDAPVGLINVLEGVSPDYAVVAQKAADAPLLAPFDAGFDLPWGVTLGQLAQRYESQLGERNAEIHHILARIDDHTSRMASEQARVFEQVFAQMREHGQAFEQVFTQAREHGEAFERIFSKAHEDQQAFERLASKAHEDEQAFERIFSQAREFEEMITQAREDGQSFERVFAQVREHELEFKREQQGHLAALRDHIAHQEARIAQMEAHSAEMSQRVVDILGSTSWRITGPLRRVMSIFYRLRNARRDGRLRGAAKSRVKRVVRRMGTAALRRPKLKRVVRALLRKFPALEARLYTLMLDNQGATRLVLDDEPGELSPRAARIFRQLKQEQARNTDAHSH